MLWGPEAGGQGRTGSWGGRAGIASWGDSTRAKPPQGRATTTLQQPQHPVIRPASSGHRAVPAVPRCCWIAAPGGATPRDPSQGHGQGAHGQQRDGAWQSLLRKASGLGPSPFPSCPQPGAEPAWAIVGPHACPSPSPSAWLRPQGPGVQDRDGANSSFSRRLGWDTSRNEQLLLAEQGRPLERWGCPSLATTISLCWAQV